MSTEYRVGVGHDTHRLISGGPLRIGGVDIDFDKRLDGHSDADVLLHAITDALLGAVALGDIGEMFPDTDPQHRGQDSADMLSAAAHRVLSLGWRIANLDCVIHAEQPKMLPHRDRMQARLAEILVLGANQISVKSKTGEATGPVGQGLIIQAQCVCLVQRPVKDKGEYGGIGF
ncbi:MAG: 2-C-methyl-D-erythritol 2,4-cyclodiphosphate synthase [Pirellulaceae bacterium]|nr:2-C-methyl-D-erythritol 2,4-cyclodiphosphate synthase [Pirellulaceae bacterium]